jgi:hypothetical protein
MMKALCIVLALFGQFEVQELPVSQTSVSSFVIEELPVPKAVDDLPTFDLLSADWCGGCQSVKSALSKLDNNRKSFHYREWNVDRKGWLNASSIPAFAYNGRVFQYGFSDPDTLMKHYQESLTRVKAVQSSVNTRLTAGQLKSFAYNYHGPLRGVSDNNYWRHLQDANHGFTTNQLHGLTQRDCEMIHGAHHYGYLTPYKIGN